MHKLPVKLLLNLPLRAMGLIALAMFATEQEARAYTDPGSGALIWQMLVAGLVGVSFYFRRITAWFKNRKGPKV
jgi:NADH:ubiquinone oxidoreductase subunit H